MNNKLLKAIVFLSIIIFYSSVLIHKIDLPVDDLGRHLKNGEMVQESFKVLTTNYYSQTESSYAFINHHWLSGVFFYLLYKMVGFVGMSIFNVIVFVSTFSILFFTALRKANFWLVAALSFPTIAILAERVDLRPEMFSYFFIAIFLYIITDWAENPNHIRVLWLIPLQILWVNSHLFFIIGPLIFSAFVFERLLLCGWNFRNDPILGRALLLLPSLVLVCFLNPNGLSGVLYPLNIFNHYAINTLENMSPFFQSNLLWRDISVPVFKISIFVFLLSFLFNIKNKPIFYFIACLGTIILGGKLLRTLPFFGMVFLLGLSANLNVLFSKLRKKIIEMFPVHIHTIKLIATLLFCLVSLYLVVLVIKDNRFSDAQFGLGLTDQSNSSADFFKDQNLSGPVFNNFDIGSYLIFNLFPKRPVFVDNRPEAYPDSFFRNLYLPMLSKDDEWKNALERFNFESIFFYHRDASWEGGNFIWKRAHDSNWALVYADVYAVIFVRNDSVNREIIEKFRITQKNAGERLGYLLESPNMDDVLSVGQFFYLVGFDELAKKAFQEVTYKWPKVSLGWTYLGVLESGDDDEIVLLQAENNLKKAISLGEKTCRAYSYLWAVYTKLGQTKEANTAERLAIESDSNCQDIQRLKEQLPNN